MNLFAIASLVFLTACASPSKHWITESKNRRLLRQEDVIREVEACYRNHMEVCGDTICEGDIDTVEQVIEATGRAVVWCIEAMGDSEE